MAWLATGSFSASVLACLRAVGVGVAHPPAFVFVAAYLLIRNGVAANRLVSFPPAAHVRDVRNSAAEALANG